MYVFKITDKN